jgi:thiol-disulfide isomerase/thioredoxin
VTPAARVVLGVVLVAASGPVGFLAYRVLLAGHGSVTPATTSASQDVAPAPVRHPVPERLPDLTLPDGKGTSHSLSEWGGRPLLVNFWATWCEPCRREIPLLKALKAHHADMRLEVVGVAVDFRAAVLPYVQQMDIGYPILIGEEDGLKALDAFGMDAAFPFSVFAASDGRIVALKIGELHPDEGDLILSRVADVDAGRLSLTEARRQITSALRALAVERAKRSDGAAAASPGKS